MTGFVLIENGNEDDLKTAVATMGPVAVAVDAYSRGFQVHELCECRLQFKRRVVLGDTCMRQKLE